MLYASAKRVGMLLAACVTATTVAACSQQSINMGDLKEQGFEDVAQAPAIGYDDVYYYASVNGCRFLLHYNDNPGLSRRYEVREEFGQGTVRKFEHVNVGTRRNVLDNNDRFGYCNQPGMQVKSQTPPS